MNANWLGITSAVLSLAVFFLVYRESGRLTKRSRIFGTILAVLAALPAASFALYYTHLLPETSTYYQFRSVAGTELLLVFLGAAGGLVATFLPRNLLFLPLLGVAAFSVAPFLKPFLGPIPAGALQDSWKEGICLQSTPSTCGAASVATILRFLGGDATEPEIAAAAHSYAGGTEAWYLARAVRSRGFEAEFDLDSEFSPEGDLPAVVGVRLGSIGHFVPVLAQRGDRFLVGDPMIGKEWLSHDQLKQRYDFTGFHLRIRPGTESTSQPGT